MACFLFFLFFSLIKEYHLKRTGFMFAACVFCWGHLSEEGLYILRNPAQASLCLFLREECNAAQAVQSDILLDRFLCSRNANTKTDFFPVKPVLRQYCRTNLSLHKGYFLSGAFPFFTERHCRPEIL